MEKAAAGEGPLFSLVMCLYGVEDHVARAVRSVLSQECGDFELVLVDDAARDRSLERALAEAAGDPRVRVVRHRENRGLSAARNTGLDAARGRYVSFPDPDDTVAPAYLSAALAAIEACDPDIVVEGVTEQYFDRSGRLERERPIVPEAAVHRGDEVAAAVLPLEVQTLVGYVNSKFFRRSLVGDLRFDTTMSLSEDFFFSIEMFDRAKTVAVADVAAYRYAKRATGSLTSRWDPAYYDIHRSRIARLQMFQEDHGLDTVESRQVIGGLYGRYVVSALMRVCDRRSGLTGAQQRLWCRQVFSDPLFELLVPVARSQGSRAVDLSLAVLRRKSPILALALGRGVSTARTVAAGPFSKIQQGR